MSDAPPAADRPICRLLILSNIPTPNNDALFSAIHRTGITLCVAYCDWKEPNRLWALPTDKAYPYVVMPGITLEGFGRLNLSVFGVLRRFRPDRVVLTGGYAVPTVQLVAWWLTITRRRWWYWSEELNWDQRGRMTDTARAMLRYVLRFAEGILAIGKRSAASFRRLGISDDRIKSYHYYADADHFALPEDVRTAHRKRIRESLGIPDDALVFLFAGQLIHRKGLDLIVDALGILADRNERPWLVVVGDGPEAERYKAMTRDRHLADRVRFVGFVQVPDLPGYGAASDALLVPSRQEGWGLVVSEFMAAGLPVIASDETNSALNLIDHAKSGYLFPSEDVQALADVLSELMHSTSRQTMAREAKKAVEPERPATAAVRLIRLLDCGAENAMGKSG